VLRVDKEGLYRVRGGREKEIEVFFAYLCKKREKVKERKKIRKVV
jgi:hypothetical protein